MNEYLQNTDLYYEPQKIYPDLRAESGYPLSYDFLVYINGSPYAVIECQGKQHYEPIDYFGGEKQFEVQQANDAKKKQYAIENNLLFIEIPYTLDKNSIIQLLQNHFNIKGSV